MFNCCALVGGRRKWCGLCVSSLFAQTEVKPPEEVVQLSGDWDDLKEWDTDLVLGYMLDIWGL